jgi:signal transduction histidine kinase
MERKTGRTQLRHPALAKEKGLPRVLDHLWAAAGCPQVSRGDRSRCSTTALTRYVRHTGGVQPRPGARNDPAGTWARLTRRSMGFGVVVGLGLTVIWALTGAGYLWPGWMWFALALPAAASWSVRGAQRTNVRRSVAVHAAISVVISAALIAIWLLSSHRYFWPIWPILGLAVIFAGDALFVPSVSRGREQALAARVDVLTRTRKDALDVQVAEMRRVERDLHDGAQARLVSLGMSLGMADELLDSDPDAARRLLGEARPRPATH